MTIPAQPRHARAEIRAFAKELRKGGWIYERNDSKGHTLWSHPRASGLYKLAETPSHFSVQRARRDVLALLGEQPAGKRRPKEMRRSTGQPAGKSEGLGDAGPAPILDSPRRQSPAAVVPLRRKPARLPWEDQPDNYDRGLARLMSAPPGSY